MLRILKFLIVPLYRLRYRLTLLKRRLKVFLAKQGGLKVGKRCWISECDFLSEPYLIEIGDNCVITLGVTLVTHDLGISVAHRYFGGPKLYKVGKIQIKDNSFIGTRSIILPNVTIGPNSVVGAGSVVTKDVPPNTVVAGNPARVICSLEEYYEKCKAKSIDLSANRRNRRKEIERAFSKVGGSNE